MRRDITFNSKGLQCVGWLYVPDNLPAGQKAPTIVMAHGFSATKEQALDRFAEQFVNAGFVTMVFDYRFLGGSEGEPRCQILWYEQIEDYRNAITWVSDQPEVNPDRIGIWGTSFSGAHVLWVSAYDKRVKAVVSQVHGGVSLWDATQKMMGPEGPKMILETFNLDRIQRQKTGAVNYMPVVAPEGEPAVLAGPEAYHFFTEPKVPSWRNEVTIESLEKSVEYDLTIPLQRISPTPLLMVLAEYDSILPIDLAKEAFQRAGEPKAMTILPCGHFDVYSTEPWFSKASGAAVDWFKKHLQ